MSAKITTAISRRTTPTASPPSSTRSARPRRSGAQRGARVLAAAAIAVGLAWSASVATAASNLPFPNPRGPLLLHMEGTLGTERAKVGGFTTVSLGFHGQPADVRRWLGVEEVHPIGDYGVLGKNVLDALAPFEPNLIVVGPPADAARLLAVPAGTSVTIEGLVDRASRTLFLRPLDPTAPTPQPEHP